MNESWVIGFVCGLVAVAVLFRLVARKILQIDGAEKTKYDERQMIERGKGYRYAFFAYVIFNIIFFMVDTGVDVTLPVGFLMICGLLLASGVHVVYCIFHEAYWGLNNRVKNYIILLIIAGVVNLAIGISAGMHGAWYTDGVLHSSAYNLIVAIFLAVILVAMLIKWMQDKREVE
ncbi:MAG: hypothetical protein IJ471_01710 [Eubacterium sp.]|nr:hypothetical protein [Eubacterium sp.]